MECPTPETLRQLCDGKQSPADEDCLVSHIDSCVQCQTLIEQLGAADSEAAQVLRDQASSSESVLLRERLSKLKSNRPSPANGQSTAHFQDLSPWIEQEDGVLGRIDEYELVGFLGRGGMGVVFEAFDRKLQRAVALKLMSPALLTSESNSERFLREARTAAAINHPNVVSIYAVSKVEELPYLVMELVDGESLQQKLAQEPLVDIDRICEVATQIAEGLAAAHSKGVVHRDIKPANILIERDTGSVKLTDFGLARRASDELLTHTGTLLGTPEYLAPEQVDGREVDSRADLFSLGSVIYHMCVGAPPHAGNSIASTLYAVATATPPRLRDTNSSVPAWLSDLVTQLHAKNPSDRPPDATRVAELLRSRQRLKAVVKQDRKEANERPLARTAIGLLAGLLLVGSVLFAMLSGSDPAVFVTEGSEELIQYVEEHEGDLNIMLSSSEPYYLDAIQIEGRSLTVVAGEGDQPHLIFSAEPDETVLHCEDGHIELVGLRIELEQDGGDMGGQPVVDEEAIESMIVCSFGNLTLRNCEIHAGVRRCLALFEAECHLIDCELYANDTSIFIDSAETTSIELIKTNIESEIGFEITAPMAGSIALETCRFEGQVAFECTYSDEGESRLEITSDSSEFLCENAMLSVYDVPGAVFQSENAADYLPSLDWRGAENRFPDMGLIAFGDEEDLEQEIPMNEWAKIYTTLDKR